jgi:chromate reductase
VVGTARAQAHLRQVAYYNGMPLLQTEEILIASAGEKFDSDGSLKDDETREHLSNLAGKFADWLDQQ